MNYLHLYSWSPRNVAGGMETVINITAKEQAKIGHKVFVLGRIQGKTKKTFYKKAGSVTYIEVSRPQQRRPGTLRIGLFGYILLFAEIFYTLSLVGLEGVSLIRRRHIDVVFFYGIHLFPLSIIFRILGVKTILVFEAIQRNPYPPALSLTNFFRRIKYKYFDAIFTTVSEFYSQEGIIPNKKLLKQYVGDTHIFCFPWGIDSDLLKKTKPANELKKYKQEKYKIIVCPRRLVEEKGVRYLLEALPNILQKYPKTVCVFTSYGILKNELIKRTKELGILKNILFTGPIAYEKVLEVIKSGDVMVAPSSGEELFGMVFLEAYSLKVPIVTTKFGGIPSVVENGKTGILVQPKDKKALSDAIIAILSKKSLSEKFIKNGYKVVYEKFQLRDTIRSIDFYIGKLFL